MHDANHFNITDVVLFVRISSQDLQMVPQALHGTVLLFSSMAGNLDLPQFIKDLALGQKDSLNLLVFYPHTTVYEIVGTSSSGDDLAVAFLPPPRRCSLLLHEHKVMDMSSCGCYHGTFCSSRRPLCVARFYQVWVGQYPATLV